MNCKKCIHCIQVKLNDVKVVCSNKKLLKKLGKYDEYECIAEPCYCVFYKTKKQALKEKVRKWKKTK